MRTFLFLLVLLAGAAAGYEYFQHTQEVADYIDKRGKSAPDIARWKSQNQAQLAENAALTAKLTSLQTQAAQLKEQVSTAAESAPTPAPAPSPAAAPGAAPAP